MCLLKSFVPPSMLAVLVRLKDRGPVPPPMLGKSQIITYLSLNCPLTSEK